MGDRTFPNFFFFNPSPNDRRFLSKFSELKANLIFLKRTIKKRTQHNNLKRRSNDQNTNFDFFKKRPIKKKRTLNNLLIRRSIKRRTLIFLKANDQKRTLNNLLIRRSIKRQTLIFLI